jgi:hypothetical protein
MVPTSDFAILMYDPSTSAGPMRVVLQGSDVEVWGPKACEEAARALDQGKPKLALMEMMLAGGVRIEAPTLIEQNCPRVVVIGALMDTRWPVILPEEDGWDCMIPPCEIETMVDVLKGSANNARSRNGIQTLKGVA